MYEGRFSAWMNEQLSPACREQCWIGNHRVLCENCSDIDVPGNEVKRRICGAFCNVHGSCPMSSAVEKPHPVCPAYDPSLRDNRVALLKSLGATVQPGAVHGIEVHGISIREPWVLAHSELQCAIKHLTQDYVIVNFKGQVGTSCELDEDLCYSLGPAHQATNLNRSGPRVNVMSNHPLLGTYNLMAEGWHMDGTGEACTHGIFDVVQAQPPRGNTGFSIAREVINSLPKERLDYWKRIWWQSTAYDKLKNVTFPLIVEHPITGELIIYVHNYVVFGIDMDTPSGRMFEPGESKGFQNELDTSLTAHSFNMSWETGDVAFVDNFFLLHKSWPQSAESPDLGLRVVRKTTCNCLLPPFLPHNVQVGGGQ
eukprot:jgi/Mesvir1/125/Mv07789-RA.2